MIVKRESGNLVYSTYSRQSCCRGDETRMVCHGVANGHRGLWPVVISWFWVSVHVPVGSDVGPCAVARACGVAR